MPGVFCGSSSGLSIGHVSPEAASGGEIALVEDSDMIDIPNRSITLEVDDAELDRRRVIEDGHGYLPLEHRPRKVTAALRAYAAMATSADTGAVRDVESVERALRQASRQRAGTGRRLISRLAGTFPTV